MANAICEKNVGYVINASQAKAKYHTFVSATEAIEMSHRLLNGPIIGKKTFNKWRNKASGTKHDFDEFYVGRTLMYKRDRILEYLDALYFK